MFGTWYCVDFVLFPFTLDDFLRTPFSSMLPTFCYICTLDDRNVFAFMSNC